MDYFDDARLVTVSLRNHKKQRRGDGRIITKLIGRVIGPASGQCFREHPRSQPHWYVSEHRINQETLDEYMSEVTLFKNWRSRRRQVKAVMNDRPDPEWEKILGSAMRLVTAGVDPDAGAETVADALAALGKQAKALKAAEYTSEKTKLVLCPHCAKKHEVELPAVDALAKTMAHTAKMIDETARLVQFVNGKPDSRPEIAGMDWLSLLSSEQVSEIMRWVEERKQLVGEAYGESR